MRRSEGGKLSGRDNVGQSLEGLMTHLHILSKTSLASIHIGVHIYSEKGHTLQELDMTYATPSTFYSAGFDGAAFPVLPFTS